MITITMPMWFAVSLTIYLVLDMIAKILKVTIDEVENKRQREYRRHMNETYRTDREYSLSDWDMQEFADFLHKEFPDLVGIKCYFGTGDSKIWFYREDLEKTRFY